MIPAEWIDQATVRLAPHIRRTLLTNDAELNLYLKWENLQVTGSFKARGALNRVFVLDEWERMAGLVTASAGNHGVGVALASKLVGAPALIFVPEHAVKAKVDAIRALGAEIRTVNGGYALAEKEARAYALESQKTFVSAYNDSQVIAGQGTIAREILRDLPDQAGKTWLVPLGGGGLLAGLGTALEDAESRPRLVGVQAAASAFMHSLYHTGGQDGVTDLSTLADGLSGAVEDDSLTIPMIKRYADDVIVVGEEDIKDAIAYSWARYHQKLEGSGAVGLAAVLTNKVKSPAVIIISGGNIQPELHASICDKVC